MGILSQSLESTSSKPGKRLWKRNAELSRWTFVSRIEPSHALSVRFCVSARAQVSDQTNVASSLSPNRRPRDQLRDSKAGATSLGAAANFQRVYATDRIPRGFTLREPVDSQHSRRIPIIELKNRRTFTLFTTNVWCCSW